MKIGTTLVVLAVAAFMAGSGRAAAQDRLLQQTRDSATGAWMRLYQTADGQRIEVEAPAMTIRKQVKGDTVVTTLRSGKESLALELGPEGLTVSGSAGHVTTGHDNPVAGARAKRLVAASPLSARAAALIAKLSFAGLPTLQPVLLTTRALLLAAADDESGTSELKAWFRNLRMRSQVVKAGGAQRTPSDCWKGYGDELLAAFDEYMECVRDPYWWEGIPPLRCGVLYEIRIIGASTWYAGCVSLGGLIGK